MAAFSQSSLLSSSIVILILFLTTACSAKHHGNQKHHNRQKWKKAHATFYGGSDASGTMGGACGYENLVKDVYGLNTTALSAALFKGGEKCGACFEIKCAKGNQYCRPGEPSLFVTATNECPSGGWCSRPKKHFDLSEPSFLHIAEYKAGVVPIQYRKVSCQKQGGVKFTITGNPHFNLVSVMNVGGAGDVKKVEVRGKNLPWTKLQRNWGQKWETDAKLVGQKLSFRITTSNGKTSTSYDVAPENWQFGQTFEGNNFR